MKLSDLIAAFALIISLLAWTESRRARQSAKRHYAAERREETLASAKNLRETVQKRLDELKLYMKAAEFRVPADIILDIGAMISSTERSKESLDRTISKIEDDRSIDANDVLTWFSVKRDIEDIMKEDLSIIDNIKSLRIKISEAGGGGLNHE